VTLIPSCDDRAAQSPKRLLVAIHDVGPRFESEIDRLRDILGNHVPAEKLALLVVPDHGGEAPVAAGSPFACRLRGWAESGAEIFVHGWFHHDTSEHRGRSARSTARYLTENEGEFFAIDLATSRQRMADGKRLIEDIIGRAAAGFIAPAWSYGPEALEALAESDFALAEDDWTIWRPTSGEILCHGPVIAWASPSGPRIVSSLVAAQILPSALHSAPVVRLAVHPGDSAVPSLLTSIDRVLDRLCRRRSLARYADLLPLDS
jgi:predicted deacetylase